jgi:hypothetical protein
LPIPLPNLELAFQDDKKAVAGHILEKKDGTRLIIPFRTKRGYLPERFLGHCVKKVDVFQELDVPALRYRVAHILIDGIRR